MPPQEQPVPPAVLPTSSNKKIWWILGVVAVLLFVCAIGVWVLKGGAQPHSDVSFVPNQATTTSQTKTYTDTQFGFSFQYPAGLQMSSPESDGSQILFNVVGSHNLATSTVNISVSTPPQLVANCLIAPKSNSDLAVSDVSTTTINGVPFLSYRKTVRGPYVILSDMNYLTIKNDECYTLNYVIVTTPNDKLSSSQAALTPSDQTAVENEVGQIIQSFQFTN
jgi:hypothetical protein